MSAHLDERGFFMPGAGCTPSGRPARRGLPWTVAEDAHLMKRLRDLEALGDANPIVAAAAEIQRGVGATATRLRALRAGIEVALAKPSGNLERSLRAAGKI